MAELNGLSLRSHTDLRAYYRFESGTLTTDDSGNSNTLTAISDPAEDASGKYGGAVALDGNDAYSAVDIASLKPTGNFTVGGWIKTSTTGAFQTIFQSLSVNTNIAGWILKVDESNVAYFLSGKNSGSADGTDFEDVYGANDICDGNWHLLVATWDGSNIKLYVDDDTVVTQAWVNAPVYAATNYVRIGARNLAGTNSEFFTGSLDDVFLFNGTALTADQVSALYSSTILTTTIEPSIDTFLHSSSATTNYGTNTYLYVGELKGATDVRRTLIKFNVASLANTTIKSATLRFYDAASGDYADNARTMSAYRVLRTWVETEATWNVYSTGNNWGTAGCANTSTDREAAAMGTSTSLPAAETEGWIGFDLTASLVEDWYDGGLTNNGMLLQMATETDDTHQFFSSEGTYPPQLIIDYEPSAGGNFFAVL